MKAILIIITTFCLLVFNASAQNIFDAARQGDTTALQSILSTERELMDSQDGRGYTALILAVYNNQYAAAKLLLDAGANPDLKDNMGNTALMGIGFKGGADLAKLLLESGADANVTNHNDATALVFAATFGHTDVIRELLAYGADKSLADNRGLTPLDHAKNQENKEVIVLLSE